MAGRKDIYVAKWFLFMFHSSGQLTINLALLVLACVKAWLLALKDVRFSTPGTLETSRVKVYRRSGTDNAFSARFQSFQSQKKSVINMKV